MEAVQRRLHRARDAKSQILTVPIDRCNNPQATRNTCDWHRNMAGSTYSWTTCRHSSGAWPHVKDSLGGDVVSDSWQCTPALKHASSPTSTVPGPFDLGQSEPSAKAPPRRPVSLPSPLPVQAAGARGVQNNGTVHSGLTNTHSHPWSATWDCPPRTAPFPDGVRVCGARVRFPVCSTRPFGLAQKPQPSGKTQRRSGFGGDVYH